MIVANNRSCHGPKRIIHYQLHLSRRGPRILPSGSTLQARYILSSKLSSSGGGVSESFTGLGLKNMEGEYID